MLLNILFNIKKTLLLQKKDIPLFFNYNKELNKFFFKFYK